MNCREKNDYICNFCPPQIDGSYLLFNSNKTAFPNCCSYNYNPTQKNNEGQYRSNYFGYTEDYIKKFDQQRRSKRGSNAVQDSSAKLNNNAAPRGFCPCMPPQNNMCVCANSFPQNAIRIPLNACVASSPIGPGPFNPCVCNEAPQVQDRIEFCNHQDMHENKLNGLGFHDILCNDMVQTQTSCCEHLPQIPQPCKCCGLDTPSESQLVAEKTDEIPPEDQLCIPHEGTVSKYTVQNLSYRPFCVIVEEPENENCICNNDNNTKNNNININNNNNNNLNNSYNNVHNGARFNNFYQLRPYYWYCPYCGTIVCCKCPQACPYPYCTLNQPNQRLY